MQLHTSRTWTWPTLVEGELRQPGARVPERFVNVLEDGGPDPIAVRRGEPIVGERGIPTNDHRHELVRQAFSDVPRLLLLKHKRRRL